MYATMARSNLGPRGGQPTGNGGEMFPEFVPPPPPMFDSSAGIAAVSTVVPPQHMAGGKNAKQPPKPPVPPGKPDKVVVKGKAGKGEKKRESTV